MTTVLQISDTHIVAPGHLVSGQLDTAGSLRKTVERIKQITPQLGQVDAVLVSGDLTDDGHANSYAHFKFLMAPLHLPLFVIPGNHDLRAPMRDAFAGSSSLPATGKLNWHAQVGPIDLIGLDTLKEGEGGGEVDAATLEFLDQTLSEDRTRPALLALHHPPFASGITFMDKIGLEGHEALSELLARFDKEIRVVCGHIHTTMITTIAGKVALSAPSPCSAFAYDTSPDAQPGFLNQEDGFVVHRWEHGFTSTRIAIEPGQGPYQF